MRKMLLVVVALGMLVGLLPAAAQDTLMVVATTTIIADVAQNVGGNLVTVTALVPPDSDIHSFQPAPQVVAQVADADVVLVNGAGLEAFLGDLVENAAGIEPVIVSNGIAMLAFGGHEHHEDDAEMAHEDDHANEEKSDVGHGHGSEMATSGVITGGYVTITNTGTSADTLVGVQVDHVNSVELHQTIVENDVARMEPMTNGIEIPAGATVALAPGGLHMMLMGVEETLAMGETLSMTLVFASGTELVMPAAIGDIAPESAETITAGSLSATLAWARPITVMAEDAQHEGEDHAHEEEAHDHEKTESLGILGMDADCGDEHEGEETDHHAEGDHDHEHGACDPHVWTDPNNIMIWADNIAAAFAAADPANSDTYMANAAAYKEQLAALDAEISEILSVIPAESRIIVTNHETMGYFAAHYGFEVVGVVIGGGTTLAEPDPQTIAALVETIRAEGVKAIFAENTANAALAEAVAAEVGDEVVIATLYTDALSAAEGLAPTYLDYLRQNAQTIVTALTGA